MIKEFDYQSDRHCSKTGSPSGLGVDAFDYQSDRHCSKTLMLVLLTMRGFDYQSDRHCSKTRKSTGASSTGLITSQIDTAPKRWSR